jgi:regulator of sigma E protease
MIFDGFKDLFSGDVDIDDISGPVGIAKISGEAAQSGFNSILTLLAILSINLGFVNILPFPALDGGRIAIVLAEVFSRRKIPIDTVNMINGIGFLILMLFIIYITYKDIVKIFFK